MHLWPTTAIRSRRAWLPGNVCKVLNATYRELFVAIAGCAGALTGLLFVALSVSPHSDGPPERHVIRQVRAAAALLAFTNALAISLFSLVPDTNVGYPSVAMGVSGLLFTAAGIRSILASPYARHRWRRQAGLIMLLAVIFGAELVNGIDAIQHPTSTGPLQGISYSIVGSLIVGVARAWELVGDRDTGILSSIAVLVGHEHSLGEKKEPDQLPEPANTAVAGPSTEPNAGPNPEASAHAQPAGKPAVPEPPIATTD
jgi:hypothetical protein